MLRVLPFTYLDDVLMAGGRRMLKRVARMAQWKLRMAKFLLSPKLVVEPQI